MAAVVDDLAALGEALELGGYEAAQGLVVGGFGEVEVQAVVEVADGVGRVDEVGAVPLAFDLVVDVGLVQGTAGTSGQQGRP